MQNVLPVGVTEPTHYRDVVRLQHADQFGRHVDTAETNAAMFWIEKSFAHHYTPNPNAMQAGPIAVRT